MLVDFHTYVQAHLETVYRETGVQLDVRLSGSPVAGALHLDLDPAMRAVVRTELQIVPEMRVDLRELVDARPPVSAENLFASFTAESAGFRGRNATEFGLHITRVAPSDLLTEILNSGSFVGEARVAEVYQVFIYLKDLLGRVSLAHSAAAIGFDESGQLVAYQTFQANRGLEDSPLNAPSRLAPADRPAMLYVFLALSVFMAVNQGEAPLRWSSERKAVVG